MCVARVLYHASVLRALNPGGTPWGLEGAGKSWGGVGTEHLSLSFIAVTTLNTTDAIFGVHLHPRAAAHKPARASRTRELAKSVLSTSH